MGPTTGSVSFRPVVEPDGSQKRLRIFESGQRMVRSGSLEIRDGVSGRSDADGGGPVHESAFDILGRVADDHNLRAATDRSIEMSLGSFDRDRNEPRTDTVVRPECTKREELVEPKVIEFDSSGDLEVAG